MTETLEEQLIRHEGMRLKVYQCPAGKWTIGVGRNLEDNGIAQFEARYLLRNDIDRITADLHSALPWFVDLDSRRQDVLINMAFNMGVAGLLKFKYMLSAIERKSWDEAAWQMEDSKWAKQVGNRAIELAEQMRKG